MKSKYAIALLVVATIAAVAAPLDPRTTTPQATFYIAGSTAQKAVITAIVPSTVFATSSDVVTITGNNNSQGWLGMSVASLTGGTSKPTLVVFNSSNGSGAGLNQLLSTDTHEPEAQNISLPDSTCSALGSAPYASFCTHLAPLEVDMAVADVQPTEFPSAALGIGGGYLTLGQIQPAMQGTYTSSTGLEGFGVIVNVTLYNALLAQNIHDKILPTSCATATAPSAISGVCQPSIGSLDYGSVATKGGDFGTVEWQAIAPDQSPLQVTLCNRNLQSGTQAAANIFFLNNVCGTKGFGGAFAQAVDSDTTSSLVVVANPNNSTAKAETCVATANGANSGYAMGVISLVEPDHVEDASRGYYYVKLDRISPNYKADGTLDPKHRDAIRNGYYHFATEMSASVRTTIANPAKAIATAMAGNMANSSFSDLVGIAYVDNMLAWPGDGKNSKYIRGMNNCAPLH